MDKREYYEKNYLPTIVKYGRITSALGAVAMLLPLFVLKVIFGIDVDMSKWTSAVTIQITLNLVWWIVDPISVFPALGPSGTIITCLSGNMHNLRLPAALTAQSGAGYEPGSTEGSVMATIGVAYSVFINVAFLAVAILLGNTVLAAMPPYVTTALGYLLPALYGAMFAQYAIADLKTAVLAFALAYATYQAYMHGWLNWIPLEPAMTLTLIPLIGTIIYVRARDGKKEGVAAA